MFINKLNQLYKPERVLYYTEASVDEIEAYYRGLVSESVAKYTNTFGSYD